MKKLITPSLIIIVLLLSSCNSFNPPKIKVSESEFSFNEVINGAIVNKEIIVYNTGNQILIIDSVSSSCGCTVPSIDNYNILPGESATLNIEFDSGAHGPEFLGIISRMVFIQSNDPKNEELIIEFDANVLDPNLLDINGANIFYYGINLEGERIDYSGGPNGGGMMMKMSYGCSSCHGFNGEGQKQFMHMQTIDAPDIRFSSLLSGEEGGSSDGHDDDHAESHSDYDLDDFYHAVVLGQHPDGSDLDEDMPRWDLGEEDLAELFEFLKTLK